MTALRIEPTSLALDSPVLAARVGAIARDKVDAFGGTVGESNAPGLLGFFGLEPSEDAPIRAAHAAMAVVAALRRSHGGEPPVIAALDVLEGRVAERGRMGVVHPDDAAAALDRLGPLLSHAQPGDIVAGAAALPHVERAFDDAPVLDADGPVRLVKARGTFAGTTRRAASTFVGRQRELSWLARRIEGLAPGQGLAIGLIGEPGVGKSRLLHEVRQLTAPLGIPWLEGRCVDHGTATPYLPLVDLLRNSLHMDEHTDVAATVASRLHQAGVEPEEDGPYLEWLLGSPGGARVAQLKPETIRTRTFEILRRVIQRGAGPVVVAIEDVHWIDPTSEAFLGSLVEPMPAPPVLLIVTHRPGYSPPWIDRSCSTQLAIRPLDAAAGRAIVSGILRARRAGEASAERIVRQAEGNPFFLEELAWSVGPTDEPGSVMPGTVRDVLSARIDRLPDGSQRLLETASVLGRHAPQHLLEALVEDRDALGPDLDVLIAREFLHEHQTPRGLLYAFKHVLTQEVAYSRLGPPDRRRLHAAAGREIERLNAGAMDAVLTEVAHHAVHAESWDRAYQYLRAAATRATRGSGFFEWAELLQQALTVLQKLPPTLQRDRQEFETLLELWTAYFESGQYARIADLIRRVEPLGGALGDQANLGALLVRRAQLHWGNAEPRETLANAREALRLAEGTDARTRSYAHFLAGAALRDSGVLHEGLDHLDAGARLLEGVGPEHPDAPLVLPILVNVDAWRAEAYAVLGRYQDASVAATAAIALARSIANDSALVFGQAFCGYTRLLRGDLAEALPVLEEAFGLIPRGEYANATYFAAGFLAYALALAGERLRALQLLDEHFRLGARPGPIQRTRYRTVTTAAYLAAGQPDHALRELNVILPVARRADARGHLPALLRMRAEALLHFSSADLEEAQTLSQEALEMAVSARLAPEVARCHVTLGRAHIRAGRVESGREHVAQARVLFGELGMEYWLTRLTTEAESARPH